MMHEGAIFPDDTTYLLISVYFIFLRENIDN